MDEPDDMTNLAASVDEVAAEVKMKVAVPGTYLPLALVEAQTELAALPDFKVTKMLADLIVHVSVRRGLAMTPRKLLEEIRERYPISDEAWFGRVGPELRKILLAAGYDVVKLAPSPPFVRCENCGRDTTGDYTWDWPAKRMVVCSVCASMGQPETPPAGAEG